MPNLTVMIDPTVRLTEEQLETYLEASAQQLKQLPGTKYVEIYDSLDNSHGVRVAGIGIGRTIQNIPVVQQLVIFPSPNHYPVLLTFSLDANLVQLLEEHPDFFINVIDNIQYLE